MAGHSLVPMLEDPLHAYFSQMNDIFTRAFWDDRVRSKDSDAFFAFVVAQTIAIVAMRRLTSGRA